MLRIDRVNRTVVRSEEHSAIRESSGHPNAPFLTSDGETPHRGAGCSIQRDDAFIDGHADDAVPVEKHIARKTAVAVPFMLVLPRNFACRAIKGIKVTDEAISTDEDAILRHGRRAMKFALSAVSGDVVDPDRSSAGAIDRREHSGARSDVDDVAHDRGRDEDSASGLVLPQQFRRGERCREHQCENHEKCPSIIRRIPRGFKSFNSSGRIASGAFCHATGRAKRSIARVPTDVERLSDVAG